MTWLLFAGVLAQGGDAVSMDPRREANEFVLGLGPTAYLAKIALILGVTAPAWSLPRLGMRPRLSRLRRPAALLLSWLLLGTGLLGAVSNLLASASF